MNIFYASSVCSKKKFKEIYETNIVKPQQQAQKFHSLFIKGLAQWNNQIFAMSALPINHLSSKKKWSGKQQEIEDEVSYYYLPFINFPVIKHLFIFISGFLTCLLWGFKNKNKMLVCDVLNVTNSVSALLVSKLLGFKSVAIVTDIPTYMSGYSLAKKSGYKALISMLYRKICSFFMCRYDMYMILTEQMNEVVNPRNKPFIVIEGMVDSEMVHAFNNLEEKYEEKVIIYAGALYEKYGIKKLIDAFMKVNIKEARLWLFGSGELEEEIKKYEVIDERIKYFGVVPNREVVKEELKATLLINPRPSIEEFTKFSFPSKNMEYMASGTPILTTLLPGMMEEYYEHIYIIENECVDGLADTIQNILTIDKEELFIKGDLAKKFVLREKSNLEQAKKFMEKFG